MNWNLEPPLPPPQQQDAPIGSPSTSSTSSSPSSTPAPLPAEKLVNVRQAWHLCSYDLIVVENRSSERVRNVFLHKAVFEAASPVFKYLLETQEKVKLSVDIDILEVKIETDIFQIIRDFVYEDALPQRLEMRLALKLLEAGFQYEIENLVPQVIDLVENAVTPEVAFQVLQTARLVECRELEEHALQLIISNSETLINSPEFNSLGSYDVCRILSSDDLRWKEVDIFRVAMEWANTRAQLVEHENAIRAVRCYFNQVKYCVRFPLMTTSELADVTYNHSAAVEPEDVAVLFQYLCGSEQTKETIPESFSRKPRRAAIVKTATAPVPSPSCSVEPSSASSAVQADTPTATGTRPPCTSPPPPVLIPAVIPALKRSIICNSDTTESEMSSEPEGTPAKLQRVEETKQNDFIGTDGGTQDMPRILKITDKEVATFEYLARRFVKDIKTDVVAVDIFNVEIQNNYHSTMNQKFADLSVDVRNKFLDKDTFPDFVSHFDPMRYIFLNVAEKDLGTTKHIWSMDRDVLLKFNGVTFLRVEHLERESSRRRNKITLNYIRDSAAILSDPELRPHELALSNCEFPINHFKERGNCTEKLCLYRVWGEYSLEEILKSFPKLKELKVWKVSPQFGSPLLTAPLTLNFFKKFNINKLMLFEAQLIFPEVAVAATKVSQLYLDHCHTDNVYLMSQVFHRAFPCLNKLVITEHTADQDVLKPGNIATASLINCVRTKISKIESVLVEGMKWTAGEDEDDQLSTFLDRLSIKGNRPINFEFVKKGARGQWRGRDLGVMSLEENEDAEEEEQGKYNRDEMEFNWWDLSAFYDSVEVYEDYFLQDADGFPRPILWT